LVTIEFTQPPDHVPSAHDVKAELDEPGAGVAASVMLGGGSEVLVIWAIVLLP
jgi:hypothetical protein